MHSHHNERRNANKRGLIIAAVITTVILVLEFVGGIMTNSLALLSDSGHMLSDVSSLMFSLFAIWLANKPASLSKTFGYYRFEIIAAFVNGITLFVIAALIVIEAYKRFLEPQLVASETMIAIAVIGFIANLLSAVALLRSGDVENNLNMRSAYLHVVGDALGSVGAIIAGIFMYNYDWYVADPIISVLVAAIILKGAWRVIRQSAHILMEGAPENINPTEIKQSLSGIGGVIDIHNLHIWTITSGLYSFTCHLRIASGEDSQSVLDQASVIVRDKYHFYFSAIQIETRDEVADANQHMTAFM